MGIFSSIKAIVKRAFGASSKSSGVGTLRIAMQGGTPGGWASDHKKEALNFTGWTYVSLHAIGKAAAAATVTVHDSPPVTPPVLRKTIRKYKSSGAAASHDQKTEGDTLPATHPLVKLMNRPNPAQSGAQFRYEQILQLGLTGICLVWNVRRNGVTYERYVIPTAIVEPVRPGPSLPRGGYRVMPTNMGLRYDEDGYVSSVGYWQALGRVLPAEEIEVIKWPHPIYKDDGLGPLAAGAAWIDLAQMVDQARWSTNKRGGFPSAIVTPPDDVDASSDELAALEDELNAKYGGPENAGKLLVAGHGTVTPLGTTAREMAFEHGHDQVGAAVRSLFATPGGAVGLFDQGTYGALAASFRGFSFLAVKPQLDLIADEDTATLAQEFGQGIKITMSAPSIDDPDLIERQISQDVSAGAITRGEIRRLRGRQPFGDERDDMEAGSYGLQVQQMAMQNQQMQMQMQMAAAQGGGATPGGGPGGAQAAPGEQDAEEDGQNATGGQRGGQGGEVDENAPLPTGRLQKTWGLTKTWPAKATQWVGVYMPSGVQSLVREYQERVLDDGDVLAYEDRPHVTIRYGVLASPAQLQRAVAGTGLIAFTLGPIDVFHGPDKDVLIQRVTSGTLPLLRRRIEQGIYCGTDRHPDYTPHVTLAYLKPGMGEKYIRTTTGLEGEALAAGTIAISDTDSDAEFDVSLGGAVSASGTNLEAPSPKVKAGGAPAACGENCGCKKCSQNRWLAVAIEKTVKSPLKVHVIEETPNDAKHTKELRVEDHMPEARKCDFGECELQVYGVLKRIERAGMEGPMVVRGSVDDGGLIYPHTWIEHKGKIYDPTRQQFSGKMSYAPEGEYEDRLSMHDFLHEMEQDYGHDVEKHAWPAASQVRTKTLIGGVEKTPYTSSVAGHAHLGVTNDEYLHAQKLVAAKFGEHGTPEKLAAKSLENQPHYSHRVDATWELLNKNAGVKNAVLHAIKLPGREKVLEQLVNSPASDAMERASKEFSDTPVHDLHIANEVEYHPGHDERRGLALMHKGWMQVFGNSMSGDWRHELGHLVHATLDNGPSADLIHSEYKKAVSRAKQKPIPEGEKWDTNKVQDEYGVPSLRGLDDEHEFFAEHYRGYHRSVYQDKEAGGGTHHLDLYRKRHPEMARLFDAHYTAAMLAGSPELPSGKWKTASKPPSKQPSKKEIGRASCRERV